MGYYFGVCGGIEGAVPFIPELVLQLEGVDDVAIVCDGQLTVLAVNQKGLSVTEFAAAGGGITGVANGHVTGQWIEVWLSEYLGDQTHLGVDYNVLAVGGGNPCALLPAVLQGKESKEC